MIANFIKDCKLVVTALGGRYYVQAIRPDDPARPVTLRSFDQAAPALRLKMQLEAEK